MNIIYTNHAKANMIEYGVSEVDVENTLGNPEMLFLDLKTGRLVAVKKWIGNKHLVVVFEKNDPLTIVTVFPTSKLNKVVRRRIENNRWLEL